MKLHELISQLFLNKFSIDFMMEQLKLSLDNDVRQLTYLIKQFVDLCKNVKMSGRNLCKFITYNLQAMFVVFFSRIVIGINSSELTDSLSEELFKERCMWPLGASISYQS